MQSVRSTQEDDRRQPGIDDLRAFENALGKRQPFKRSAMHFVKELLESGLIETRADGALPKLSVKG